ncbi:MAG TPA: PAS domain-containing protein, partial [Rhodoferax sp.]
MNNTIATNTMSFTKRMHLIGYAAAGGALLVAASSFWLPATATLGMGIAVALMLGGLTMANCRYLAAQLGGELDDAVAIIRTLADSGIPLAIKVKPGDTSSLLAGLKHVFDNRQSMLADMAHMTDAHQAGKTDVTLDLSKYKGQFREMADGIHGLVNVRKMVNIKLLMCAQEFANGNLDAPLETFPGDFAQAGNFMEYIRQQLKTASADYHDAQRVRATLDNAVINIMMADNDGIIRYMNRSTEQLLRRSESNLRKVLPHFSADKILNQNFDIFHKSPSHQRNLLAHLKGTHTTQIQLGEMIFKLVANPIMNPQGERIGSVLE